MTPEQEAAKRALDEMFKTAPRTRVQPASFFDSTLSAGGEFFGMRASPEVEAFRANNFLGALGSQAIGQLPFYVVGGGLLGRSAQAAKVLTKAEQLATPMAARLTAVRAGDDAGKMAQMSAALARGAAPFATGAAKWGTEAAMLETGRIAASVLAKPFFDVAGFQTKTLGEDLGISATSVAAGGLLGGAGRSLMAGLGSTKLSNLVPDFSVRENLTTQNQRIRDALGSGQIPEYLQGGVKTELDLRRDANLRDVIPEFNSQNKIQPIRDADGNLLAKRMPLNFSPVINPVPIKDKAKPFEVFFQDLFKNGPKKKTKARLLVVDDKVGLGRTELEDVLTKAGHTWTDFADYATHVRLLEFDSVAANAGQLTEKEIAAGVLNNVKPKLETGGLPDERLLSTPPKTKWTRGNPAVGPTKRLLNEMPEIESGWRGVPLEDGSWALAKRIDEGPAPGGKKTKNGKPGDRWILMVTDNPEQFVPESGFTRMQGKSTVYNDWHEDFGYNAGMDQPAPNSFLSIGQNLSDIARDYLRTPESGMLKAGTGRGLRAFVQSKLGNFSQDVAKSMANLLAPSSPLAATNPLANMVHAVQKGMEYEAHRKLTTFMQGAQILAKDGQSVVQSALSKETTGGFAQKLQELATPEVLADLEDIFQLEITPQKIEQINARQVANGQPPRFSAGAVEIAKLLDGVNTDLGADIEQMYKAMGAKAVGAKQLDVKMRKGHYLGRRLDGARRYVIMSEDGSRRGIMSANTLEEAEAKILLNNSGEREMVFLGPEVENLTDVDLEVMLRTKRGAGIAKERKTQLGADGSFRDLTTDKLIDLVSKHVQSRLQLQADAAFEHFSQPYMGELARTDPTLFKQMQKFQDRGLGKIDEVSVALDRAGQVIGLPHGTLSNASRTMQGLVSSFQMGFFNVASAVQNYAGILQVTQPEILYLMGAPEGSSRNYISVPLLDGADRLKGTASVLDMLKLSNNAYSRMTRVIDDPEYQDFINELGDFGIISPRFTEEQFSINAPKLLDLAGGTKDPASFMRWANAWGDSLMTTSEEQVRLFNATVAYELFYKGGVQVADPMLAAQEFMRRTSFSYNAVDRAQIFTNPIGGLLGNMKNWVFHQMGNQLKYAGATDETILPLLWSMGTTTALGGLAATPLVMPMADAFTKAVTGNDLKNQAYESINSEVGADALIYGLPAVLGVSLSSQIAGPGADPGRDATLLTSFAIWDRMRTLGRAMGTGMEAMSVGAAPFQDPLFRDQLSRALLPRTIYRGISAAEDNAIRSLQSGYKVLDDVSIGTAALYAAGFNPVLLDKTYAAYEEVRNDERKRRDRIKAYGRGIAEAMDAGDEGRAGQLLARGMAEGLDISSISRSVTARTTRLEQTQLESQLGADRAGEYQWAR
jgi:hypothetical protein